jgi:hypothetical protein
VGLLERVVDRAESISRGLTLDQYIQQVLASGQLGYQAPYSTYGANGKPVERLQGSFERYARDIYAAHPVIFGLMEARRSVFSEARFCWRAVKNGNPGDVLPINDGLELLETPWPGAQTGTLISHMRQDADLGGTAYVVRQNGSRGEPDRLRRLRPDWVYIVLSGDPWTDPFVDFLGITYAPNGPDNNPVEPFLPDEIAMFKPIPDPLAQFRGMSWLSPVIREIEADNAATTHRKSTLEEGAWLGPIVSAPQGTGLEAFKRFVEVADSAHAGPNRSGRMVFLAPGSEIKTVAQNFRDLDIKAITGSVETRIAAASRVPAVIAQISEGLQGSSLNEGNYGAAKRMWIDGSLRPDWRALCEALSVITPPPDLSGLKDIEPGTEAQLWILEQDIALLHEDRLEAAQVRASNATTLNTLITAGFEPDSAVTAVRDDDLSALKHSGLTSVQLSPSGEGGDQTQFSDTGGNFTDTTDQTTRSQIWRAQADHTGAMIALVPSEKDAHRLAVDGGEGVDDLHLTLFYLGDAKDVTPADRKAITAVAKAVVDRLSLPAVHANVFGAALWNPQGDEPSWVLNVGDPQVLPPGQPALSVIRRAVGDALAYGVPEFRMVRQHTPFAAHVCVAYGADSTDADELADRVGPVTFDRLRVAFGGSVTDIPLTEAKRSRIQRGLFGRKRPRDGDGDGFYDPDGKGPLPDRTPVPPRLPRGQRPAYVHDEADSLYPTERLDNGTEPEVGQERPAPQVRVPARPDLEAAADAILAQDAPPVADTAAWHSWLSGQVAALVPAWLPHLPVLGNDPRVIRAVLGRVLADLDYSDTNLATLTPERVQQLVWQAMNEIAAERASGESFYRSRIDRASTSRRHPYAGQKYRHGWIPAGPLALLRALDVNDEYGQTLDSYELPDGEGRIVAREHGVTIESDHGDDIAIHAAPSSAELERWADVIDSEEDYERRNYAVSWDADGATVRMGNLEVDLTHDEAKELAQGMRDMGYVTDDFQNPPQEPDVPEQAGDETPLPDSPDVAVSQWLSGWVDHLLPGYLPHLPGAHDSSGLRREVLAKALADMGAADPRSLSPEDIQRLVWQALWLVANPQGGGATRARIGRFRGLTRARRRAKYDGSVPPNGVADDGTKWEHPAPPRPRKAAKKAAPREATAARHSPLVAASEHRRRIRDRHPEATADEVEAKARQARIDEARNRWIAYAEMMRLSDDGASARVVEHRIRTQAKLGRLPDAERDQLLAAVPSGSVGDVARQLASAARIRLVDRGDRTFEARFDPGVADYRGSGEVSLGAERLLATLPPARKAAPRYLDPERFPAVASRLWSGESAADIADGNRRRAAAMREQAAGEQDKDRRTALLRLAGQQEREAAALEAVADLPLKPRRSPGPNPRVTPAKPAPPKPNPRTVPPAPLPSRPMTPAEQALADDFAAGRINKAQLRAALTGKAPAGFDPDTTRPFVAGLVTAGYVTELAWTGDRDRLRTYLRRQNTSTLLAAAPFFGLHLADDATHAQIVDAFVAQALRLEGPPPAPTRESLMSRKVVDLKASLRAAGLPVSGTKPVLVDRLLAALQAATGGQP